MPKVSDLMSKHVHTVEPDANVLEAAELMAAKKVGSIIVMHKGRPVGIITERDIVVKVLAARKEASSTKIVEIMSKPLIIVEPSRSVKDAAKLMLDMDIRRLVVVENETLMGIITIRDVSRSLVYAVASYPSEETWQHEDRAVIEFET